MILNSPYITGSITVTGNANVQGTLTVTGSLSGTATSASLALNSNLLQGTGSVGFATTASLLAVSSSQQQISASLFTLTASYTDLSSSYTALSGSYNTFSGSASTRITANSSSIQQVSSSQQQISASLLNVVANYATTGSNSFRADQSITGSLVVSSTITAQTLVVQTVTSSIVYSSGSNNFGNQLANRQTFTGSLNVTGSLTVNTTGTEFQVTNNGVVMGNLLADAHSVTGSLRVTGSQTVFGNLGVGITAGTNGAKLISAGGATSFFDAAGSRGISIYPSSAGNIHQITSDYIATSYYSIAITARGNNNDLFISSSGNIGIGTTTPFVIADKNLTVNGSSSAIQLGVSGIRNAQFYADGGEVRLYAVTNVPLRFGTNDTEVMRITGSLVGIGTTNPAQSLEVNGSILASSTGKIGFRYSSTDGSYYSYLRSATAGSIGPIVLAGGFESGGGSNEAIRFVTNANPGERSAVSILNSGKVGIGTTGPTTQFQIRKNYWQFWDEKAHGSNVNMFSITFPDFGSAVITVAGSRYSPGADNYSGTSIFYIYITNVGAVSVNGGNTSGTWTPTTSVASKTVTFASAYAGSSTNYSDYSVVIQASGHSGGSESAAYVTIL